MSGVIASLLLAAAMQWPSASTLEYVWWSPPTAEMVDRTEAVMAKWPLPHPIDKAERWYADASRDGRHIVYAQYTWSAEAKPGVFIAGRDPGLRLTADGRCGVYNVWYDWDAGKVTQATCGGR
jgi:hypothetical protein